MNSVISHTIESSELYHLEPRQEEYLYQESLTGYIARLANKHLMNVNQLINYELVPVLNKKYLNRIAIYGGTRFYNNASMINSVGQTALAFIENLENLTLCKNLEQCTLYPWQQVIPSRGLISPIKKWCPMCYEELLEKGLEIYEPLTWALQCVSACSIHANKLLNKCPYCKKKLRILDRYSKPGFCNYCKQWLGNKVTLERASKDEVMITQQIQDMLSVSDKAYLAKSQYISAFLNQCSKNFNGGIAEFSRLVGIPKTTVWDWCKDKNLPSLSSLIFICIKLNVHISAVLLGENPEIEIPKTIIPSFLEKRNQQDIDSAQLEKILNYHLEKDLKIPVSMKTVEKRVKISRKVFERYFPEMCKSISHKYISFTRSQATNKKEQKKVEIHNICEALTKQGVFPSRRNVEKLASWKAALRNPDMQKEWKAFIYGPDTYNNGLV